MTEPSGSPIYANALSRESDTTAPALECHGICVRFGGITALEDVDFSLRVGEIHGVVGSNGAGKSTLMRVLAGALPDYQGQVCIDGRPVSLGDPRRAARYGIAMVHQELSGIGPLSIAENLFLGRQPLTRWGWVDWRLMRQQARAFLAEMGLEIDVTRRWDAYPLVVRQMVEIARVLHSGARIILLDEPTSALSPPETERLFALLKSLPARGVSVVFISHFVEDVLRICDRVTVLRDGRNAGTFAAAEVTKHDVIQAMLGRAVEWEGAGFESSVRLPARTTQPPRLRVERLSLPPQYADVSLEIAPGECLALYGFVGAGQQDVAWTIAGARRARSGRILLNGVPVPPGSIQAAVRRGIVLATGDRARALVLSHSLCANTTVAHLRRVVGEWLRPSREWQAAQRVLQEVGCRPLAARLPVRALSGGNQQKVVLARWLLGPVHVLVLDEPTRGMDVAAKREILDAVGRLRQQRVAVLLATSEPELALSCADRIIVFHRGRVSAEFAGETVDRSALLRVA